MKKLLIVLGVVGVVLMSACSSRVINSSEGQRATVRDAIYSVEPRQNGAYVMWLRYDDEGVYCTTDKDLYAKALDVMTKGTGWAVIEYHSVRVTDLLCKDVENTTKNGAQHTIYVVDTITTSENQN